MARLGQIPGQIPDSGDSILISGDICVNLGQPVD